MWQGGVAGLSGSCVFTNPVVFTSLPADDVDLETIAQSESCDRYSGADLAALVREAALAALQEDVSSPSFVVCAANGTECLVVGGWACLII